MFIGRTGVEAETPILWPPDAKSWLFGKDPDAGEDWGQEEKGTMEDEIIGWHHRLNGLGFGWTLGVGDGQGGLACFGSWGYKESDVTERLNWTELNWTEYKLWYNLSAQFSSVQSLSSVRIFATPWTTACQASLSITNTRNLPKFMFIESVMPSNHLVLYRPLLLQPSIFPSTRVFSNESALCIRWPKY